MVAHLVLFISLSLTPVEPIEAVGPSVLGVVVDAQGRVVSKASIVLRGAEAVHADDDGTFVLEGLKIGRATMDVSAPGHMPRTVVVWPSRGEEPRRIRVVLHGTCRVSGVVRDARRKPVEGAKVTLIPEWSRHPLEPRLSAAEREEVETLEVTTAKDGRFALESLPRRVSWRVVVRHPGFVPTSQRVGALSAESSSTFKLRPGGGLSLVAVDADGLSWPQPIVRWWSDDAVDLDLLGEPEPGSDEGAFMVSRLPPGRYTLEVRAVGARAKTVRNVRVVDGKNTAVGELVLEPGVSIVGLVEDENGTPLEGIKVRLLSWVEERRLKVEVETAEDGSFRFDGLEPEGLATLKAEAEGWITERAEIQNGTLDARLVMERPAVVTASVIDSEDGAPVETFTLKAKGKGPTGQRRWGTEAGKDGVLRAELREGTYELQFESGRHQPRAIVDVELSAGLTLDLGEVVLDPGWSLEGRVVDGEGLGLADATVSAQLTSGEKRSARSSVDGRFVIEGLADTVNLRARHPEYRMATLEGVEPGSSLVTLALSPGAAVEGLVLDAAGDPIVGARVKVEGGQGASWGGSHSTTSDETGWYELAGLEPGTIRLTKTDKPAGWEGYEQAVVTGAVGERIRHDFGGGGRVVGTVRRSGEPVAGVRLTLMSVPLVEPGSHDPKLYETVRGLEARTDQEGRYIIVGVEPDLYGMTIHHREERMTREVEVVESTAETQVDIDLLDTFFEGVILDDETSEPLPDVYVMVQPKRSPRADGLQPYSLSTMMSGEDGQSIEMRGDPGSRGSSGPDGVFKVPILEDVTHSAVVFAQGYDTWSLDALEPEAFTTFHEVRMTPEEEQAEVKLTVSDPQGNPVNNLRVAYLVGGSTMLQSMNGTSSREVTPGEEIVVLVGGDGHTPIREALGKLESGEVKELHWTTSTGGRLRLFAPADSVSVGTGVFGGLAGLQFWVGEDFDWLTKGSWAFAPNARQVGEDEWLISHVPVGPLHVKLGEGSDGPSQLVDIEEGAETVVDLR